MVICKNNQYRGIDTMTEHYIPVYPNEPFDLGTLPMRFLPPTKGMAGKYLKVSDDEISTYWAAGGGGGTDDYNNLSNKPSIQSVSLVGNTTLGQIGAVEYGSKSAAHPTMKLGVDENGNTYIEY